MGPNELLLWMTARRTGSWAQFRSMVDEMDLNQGEWPYQKFRLGLASLAHVRFSAEESALRWAVLPPALAFACGTAVPTGVLCGARTRPMLDALAVQCGEGSRLRTVQIVDGPDAVCVESQSEAELRRIAAGAGLALEPNAARARLARLRPITAMSLAAGTALPFGRDVKLERFVVGKRQCSWEEVSAAAPEHPCDLYRATRFQARSHFLAAHDRFSPVDGLTGRFLVLASRGKQVARYDSARRQLSFPGICRPPLAIDQALILCTGLPPQTGNAATQSRHLVLSYGGVDADVAGLAGELLGQSRL